MKKGGVLLMSLVLSLALAGAVPAAGQPQTTCPVLAGKIDKSVYVDYQGHRIYFCCKGCDEAFKKDPEKYLKQMRDQGITPEKGPQPGKGAQK